MYQVVSSALFFCLENYLSKYMRYAMCSFLFLQSWLLNPIYLGSVLPDNRRQACLSWFVSGFRFSKFMLSIVFLYVKSMRPVPFFPFTRFITIICFWLRRSTSPIQLSLFFRIFSVIGATLKGPFIYSLWILSVLGILFLKAGSFQGMLLAYQCALQFYH